MVLATACSSRGESPAGGGGQGGAGDVGGSVKTGSGGSVGVGGAAGQNNPGHGGAAGAIASGGIAGGTAVAGASIGGASGGGRGGAGGVAASGGTVGGGGAGATPAAGGGNETGGAVGVGGAGGAGGMAAPCVPETSSWRFVVGCDTVAPGDTFHSCLEYYATALSTTNVLARESAACADGGGTVVTEVCAVAGSLGSCIGAVQLLSTSAAAEFARAYTYAGPELTQQIVADNCESDDMPYFAPGSDKNAGVPALTCP